MSRRSYNQFCATARTLDLVGERWTLLIVRELLTGPKRFSDLRDRLPGIGTGLLTARLKALEADGLVRRTTLPAPVRVAGYELTEAGAELEPAVLALARWGLRWTMSERRPDDAFHPGWAALALGAVFEPSGDADGEGTYEFRVGDETFHCLVAGSSVETRLGPAQRPDAVVRMDPDTLADIAAGTADLRAAARAGRVQVDGAPDAPQRLRALFRGPERRALPQT